MEFKKTTYTLFEIKMAQIFQKGICTTEALEKQEWWKSIQNMKKLAQVEDWISVKDKLPEKNDEYIVMNDNYDITMGTFVNDKFYIIDTYLPDLILKGFNNAMLIEAENTTHWQLLPEPPKV